MQIKFNPSGTHVKNGLLKIRLDLYPDIGDKTYALHHVLVPVFPQPDAPLGGYPRKKTFVNSPMPHWVPDDKKGYAAWEEGLVHIFQLNPALCHFITVPEDIKAADLEAYALSVFDASAVATLDEILIQENSLHLVSPFMRGRGRFSSESVRATDHAALVTSVNFKLGALVLPLEPGGQAYKVDPGTIDIGYGAVVGDTWPAPEYTLVDADNPANGTNYLNSFELWFHTDGTNVKMGTFYGSGTSYTSRDYETLGNVTSGSKQTFTGLNCDVTAGDYIGVYYAGLVATTVTAGTQSYYKAGDQFGAGTQTYTDYSTHGISIYATGPDPVVAPTVTTQAATDVIDVSCTGNGNITATGGENCTRRGFCYKVGTSGDPTTADSVAYDDGSFGTGAYNKSITGLTGGTGYRVRAYAVNSAGTGYGATVQVTTSTGVPTVTTQAASSIEAVTATGNGNITNLGGAASCDYRYMVWDTSTHGDPGNTAPAASAYAHHVDEGPGSYGTGAFTESLTGLPAGTTIYARACAHNTAGYAYGAEVTFLTKPAAPTNVAATDGSQTSKVVITWTKSTGATDYHVWRGAVDLGAAGDVATFDDTGAAAPVITPGTADASDGDYADYVTLSLAGESVANGTTHTYKVVASNATGNSADSATDTGYRGHGSITYQWQRSAADSDASYSNITGGTTDPYNDTSAPGNSAGRYFKCVLSATGASNATSTADRGYRTGLTVWSLSARIAFTTDPMSDSPSWSDVSGDMVAFTIKRGRQNQLNRIEAGTATLLLKNIDGNYWPYNTNVKLRRRVNIRAVYGGVTYDLYTGFVKKWNPVWFSNAGNLYPGMSVECVDLQGLISRAKLNNAGYAQELSGTRVGNILDDIGWNATERDPDAGKENMLATGALANVNAMDHLYSVQDSELGIFFIRGDGYAIFQQRGARLVSPYDVSLATFGNGNLPIFEPAFPLDDELIYNEVRLTRTGGAEQVESDAASILAYGLNTLSKSGLLLTSDAIVYIYCLYFLARFKDAAMRIKSFTIKPQSPGYEDTLWPLALGLDISDRITLVWTEADIVDDEYFIEGKQLDWDYRTGVMTAKVQCSDAAQYYFTPEPIPNVETLVPTGAGASTELTPSAGANWQCVDEVPISWTDYVYVTATTKKDTYALSNPVSSNTDISKVVVSFGASLSGAGSGTARPVFRIGGTDYYGSSVSPPGGGETYNQEYTTSPATGLAWTLSEITNMELGIELMSTVNSTVCAGINTVIYSSYTPPW